MENMYFCTGEVIWSREWSAKEGYCTVARSIKTGIELWRKQGHTDMTPGDRCLYSWSGRTLTCWVGGKDKRLGMLKTAKLAAGRAAVRKLKEAPELGQFEDVYVFATEESRVPSFTVGQILKVLRKNFPEVNQTVNNEIEIYDEHSRLLGTVSFKYGKENYIPKGTRKLSEKTAVAGFFLDATSSPDVAGILCGPAGLKTRKNHWTVVF